VSEFTKKLEKSYLDSEHSTYLDKLEGKLKDLEKYGKGGEKKAVYESLGNDEKEIYDKLVSGLKSKVDAMKAEKKKNEKTGGVNNDKPS